MVAVCNRGNKPCSHWTGHRRRRLSLDGMLKLSFFFEDWRKIDEEGHQSDVDRRVVSLTLTDSAQVRERKAMVVIKKMMALEG
jgi:hypothetical protein